MSKAFTKETDDDEDQPEIKVDHSKNYVTPFGLDALQTELRHLLQDERPKLVETVSWAVKNGDRSENGDYLYGKRRLREIDRRLRYLTKRLETAKVVDPAQQKNLTKVFFGAMVTYEDQHGKQMTVKLVGVDEANFAEGKISWNSPVAKALLKSEVGDYVKLSMPDKQLILKILAIKY